MMVVKLLYKIYVPADYFQYIVVDIIIASPHALIYTVLSITIIIMSTGTIALFSCQGEYYVTQCWSKHTAIEIISIAPNLLVINKVCNFD